MTDTRMREPVLNAPWPAVVVVASIIGMYALQVGSGRSDAIITQYGLVPAVFEDGDYIGLFTSIFLHGGWPHALMNAAFGLALGAPVARLLGLSPLHAIAFFLFYMVCGVLANLAYVFIHPGFTGVLIGASGAVSGLMGGAARLLGTGGKLGPILSRQALGLTGAWVIINLILAVVGSAPGSGGAPIAWEVHLIGYFLGLFLIGPWAALFGQRRDEPPTVEPDDGGVPESVGPWGGRG